MKTTAITQAVRQQLQQQNVQQNGAKDSTWEYAHQTAERARESIAEMIVCVEEARHFLTAAGSVTGEAVILITSVSKDLETAAKEWQSNMNRCMKNVGSPETASEHALILDICSGFIQIVERVLSTHSLSVARLSELVNEVYIKHQEQQNQQNILDVTKVTDVEIKNVL